MLPLTRGCEVGHRLNRTVKNWRWWVSLPVVLPVLAIAAIGWFAELLVEAFFALEDWVKSGEDQ